MHSLMSRLFLVTAVLLAAASAPPAWAVDGVTLIDQNRAIAGGVTPADPAGFPVSINQPGSYRLSGNLTVPMGVNGIEINVDGVSLDLNGFSIVGPGVFPNGAFAGITSTYQRVSVANGHIAGFVFSLNFPGAARAISLSSLLLDATTRSSGGQLVGGIGAILGTTRASAALVKDVVSSGQFQVVCPAVITDSAVDVVEVTPGSPVGAPFPTRCKGTNVVNGPI